MTNSKDFDLDVQVKANDGKKVTPNITSHFLCTVSCKTGPLMTCMSRGCK